MPPKTPLTEEEKKLVNPVTCGLLKRSALGWDGPHACIDGSSRFTDCHLVSSMHTAKNTGNIFPIFIALVVASIAWIFIDPELRRGLQSYTGIGYVPDVIEDLMNKEYTIRLHGSYLSTCSQRVLVVAKEKELDVNMHIVNTAAVSVNRCRHAVTGTEVPRKLTSCLFVNDRRNTRRQNTCRHTIPSDRYQSWSSWMTGNTCMKAELLLATSKEDILLAERECFT